MFKTRWFEGDVVTEIRLKPGMRKIVREPRQDGLRSSTDVRPASV